MSSRAHPEKITLYSEPRQGFPSLASSSTKIFWASLLCNKNGPTFNESPEIRGWVPSRSTPKMKKMDIGFVIPLIDTFLKKSPESLSEAMIRIAPGSRLTPSNLKRNGWKYPCRKNRIYVDLGHCRFYVMILQQSLAQSTMGSCSSIVKGIKWRPFLVIGFP